MIRGLAANITVLRSRYLIETGGEWRGTNHHLRVMIRESGTVQEIMSKMRDTDTSDLPDDPLLRPLGSFSDLELLAEIEKRPTLF